jgi:hypothetical protein
MMMGSLTHTVHAFAEVQATADTTAAEAYEDDFF